MNYSPKDFFPGQRVEDVFDVLLLLPSFQAIRAGAFYVPAVVSALESPNPELRRKAWQVLPRLGGLADSQAIPAVITALSDPDPWFRSMAARLVWRIGPCAEAAVPALTPLLTDSDPEIRGNAVQALGRIEPRGVSPVPPLIAALDDPDASVRQRAIFALGWIGPRAVAAIPLMASALGDPDEWMRRKAAEALGRIDPSDRTAYPALVHALTDQSEKVSSDASSALGKVKAVGEELAPFLADLLTHQNRMVRMYAAETLAGMGQRAAAATRALIEAIKDPEIDTRVVQALGAIGSDAAPALPTLVATLDDSVKQLVELAKESTYLPEGFLGPAMLRSHPVAHLLEAVVLALRWIDVRSLGRIIPFLVNTAGEVHKLLVSAIRSLGTAAIPALLEARHNPEARAQAIVARLLAELTPEGLANYWGTPLPPGLREHMRRLFSTELDRKVWDWLNVYYHVGRTGSYSGAAAELGMTGASGPLKSMAAFQKSLGLTLLESQRPKGVKLTSDGEAIWKWAKHLFEPQQRTIRELTEPTHST